MDGTTRQRIASLAASLLPEADGTDPRATELREELADHLELAFERHLVRGKCETDALVAALRDLGSTGGARRFVRRGRIRRLAGDVARDGIIASIAAGVRGREPRKRMGEGGNHG